MAHDVKRPIATIFDYLGKDTIDLLQKTYGIEKPEPRNRKEADATFCLVMEEIAQAHRHPTFIADGIFNLGTHETFASLLKTNPTKPPFKNCNIELFDPKSGEGTIVLVRQILDQTPYDFGIGTITTNRKGYAWGMPTLVNFDNNGMAIDGVKIMNSSYLRLVDEQGYDDANLFKDLGSRGALIALMVFALLHAKNVSTCARPPTKFERKNAKRHKRPCITKYKTLVVTPLRKGAAPIALTGDTTRGANARHLCRGHFKTYTKERPLFGKYVGTFWITPHMRGDAKAGRVIKDYEIRER